MTSSAFKPALAFGALTPLYDVSSLLHALVARQPAARYVGIDPDPRVLVVARRPPHMAANLAGHLPQRGREAGFDCDEIRPTYREVHYLLAWR